LSYVSAARAATLQGQGMDSPELSSVGMVPTSPQKVSPNLSLKHN